MLSECERCNGTMFCKPGTTPELCAECYHHTELEKALRDAEREAERLDQRRAELTTIINQLKRKV